jgi:UDP-2,3-diacylglucosamine hydrolase
MQRQGKIYFASDLHLGAPDKASSRLRENLFIQWLDEIAKDASELYLLGDIFDFWFEYGTVVPKGYTRLLGRLAELRDKGLDIYYFTGNHDMWAFGYFEEELGIPVIRKPIEREWNGKRFLIGHGDGLGPGDYGYKRIKRIFASKLCQWAFKWLHPDIGMRIANYFSTNSRNNQDIEEKEFLGEDKEWLIQYAKAKLEKSHYDYFIFGHRHLAIDFQLNEKSRYINLGDWIRFNSYAVFDGEHLELKYFNP